MNRIIKIATRRSALAMWQANHVKDLLESQTGTGVELVPIVTKGDRIIDRPLAAIGGKGLFLKELEVSLLEGETDLAVHSMKDMPAEMTPGLCLEVSLPRANPFDGFISNHFSTLDQLPKGATVGTSSLRRQALLAHLRPDIRIEPLRGNVDTRLSKLDAGEFDAIILACAGLERLGLGNRIRQELKAPRWMPAATQGIIGIQCREGDVDILALVQPLSDEDASAQAIAERAVARVLEGSCQVPLGAYAFKKDGAFYVEGMVGAPDGSRIIEASASGKQVDANGLGEQVAAALLEQGAAEIIDPLKNIR